MVLHNMIWIQIYIYKNNLRPKATKAREQKIFFVYEEIDMR